MNAVVRTATVADAEGIARVHVASWQWAYRGLLNDSFLDSMDVDERIASWKRQLETRMPTYQAQSSDRAKNFVEARIPFETFVADDNSELVGFARCGVSRDDDHDDSVGEVYAIYLAESAVGKGLGRELMDLCFQHFKAHDAASASVWVLTDNPRARKFYEAAGMRFDGTENDITIDGQTLPHMRYARQLKV